MITIPPQYDSSGEDFSASGILNGNKLILDG